MKILFCQRNALMQSDMEWALVQNGINYRVASYVFENVDKDDYYQTNLRGFLNEDSYDAVFSFNYIPVIADVCHELSVPYVSWGYDAGWECTRFETLNYDTNYIYHFDRKAVEEYNKLGLNRIFYLPLGVNINRLDNYISTSANKDKFKSGIAYIGNMYDKGVDIPADFNEPSKSRLQTIVDDQIEQYGNAKLWDIISTDFTNEVYRDGNVGHNRMTLIAGIAAQVTNAQRKKCIKALSDVHQMDLYTTASIDVAPKANYRWWSRYYSDQPLIFNGATINLNISLHSIQTGMPLRVLDVLGSGGFLLSNRQDELAEYFVEGEELELFSTFSEMMDKADYYMKNPEYATRIAMRGHDKVSGLFSFDEMVKKLFQEI